MGTLTPEERHFFRSDVHARQGERRTRQPHGHITEPARQVPVHERCDVLVLGGGPSGVAAAVAAARSGARTVLLERYNHLGGLSTGSWFGEGTLLRGVPRTADIIALRPSRVALMPLETFDWLRATHRSFDDFLLRQINERMHWFLGNFAAHHLLDTDSQVARALVGLFHEWLHPGSDPHLEVSQEEIANLSGLSRQRCNAALRRLASAGLLRIEYGGITVTDLDGLRRRIDG